MALPHSNPLLPLVLLFGLTAVSNVQAQTLYGSDVSLDQTGTIDPANGAWTALGNQGIPSGESINGIAYDEVHDILFGINTSTDELVTLDQVTGLATTLGVTSGGQFNGLANNPTLNVLYSVTTGDALYRIDPSNGASTFIGSSVIPDQIEGLGYDPISGNLYGLNGQGQIYAIDTTTGSSSALPNAIGVGGIWRGLTWDATGQRLLAATVGGFGGQLFEVDATTGLGTLIGSTTNFAQGLGMTGSVAGPPSPIPCLS